MGVKKPDAFLEPMKNKPVNVDDINGKGRDSNPVNNFRVACLTVVENKEECDRC